MVISERIIFFCSIRHSISLIQGTHSLTSTELDHKCNGAFSFSITLNHLLGFNATNESPLHFQPERDSTRSTTRSEAYLLDH